jgi:hypothetical protein
MLERVLNRLRGSSVNACFCTLAIHAPYRQRAQLLINDAPTVPWIVFTDEPNDFAQFPVRVVKHEPTGPMAIDFLTKDLPPTGNGRGGPAYHDKRFVVEAALRSFDTAIFVDADTRVTRRPRVPPFKPGISIVRELHASISEHLSRYGSERLPAFEHLALNLIGDVEVLKSARWCSEALFAITKDGNESRFFEGWTRGAELLRSLNLYSGEGGVIGLAAKYAGWTVDYDTLATLAASTMHEGQGPKQ